MIFINRAANENNKGKGGESEGNTNESLSVSKQGGMKTEHDGEERAHNGKGNEGSKHFIILHGEQDIDHITGAKHQYGNIQHIHEDGRGMDMGDKEYSSRSNEKAAEPTGDMDIHRKRLSAYAVSLVWEEVEDLSASCWARAERA